MERKFTVSSVLYAITGAVPIIRTASEEYKKQAEYEIKNDLVYSFVLSDISDENRFYDDLYPDYDPIVSHYICGHFPEIKKLREKYMNQKYNSEVIRDFGYVSIEKMDEEVYTSLAKMYKNRAKRINNKLAEKERKTKMIQKLKRREAREKRYYE